MRARTRIVMFLAIGVCLGCGIWFGLLGRATTASQEQPKRPRLSALPKIKSCVEHVKVVKAELVNQGDSQVVALELENQAYLGVLSVSVEQLYVKGKNSVVLSGYTPDKPPLVVMAPGERKTMTLGNLRENSVIRIGAVVFSDGTEEGCKTSLKETRELKERDSKKGATR